jgi:hypothetical protein
LAPLLLLGSLPSASASALSALRKHAFSIKQTSGY